MLENSKLTPPKNKSFQVHLLQEEVSALIKSYKKQFDIFLLEAIKGQDNFRTEINTFKK